MQNPPGLGFEFEQGPLYDAALLGLVPSKVALGNRVLPVGFSGTALVCMAKDPDDPFLQSRLRFQLQREVRLIPARDGFDDAMREAYGGDPCPETEDLVSAVSGPAITPRALTKQNFRPWNAAPRVVAVTSGKGGVGKTTLTANIGLALSRIGLNVAAMDCDFGLSNLHVMLGMRPEHKLPDVLQGRVALADAFAAGPDGLRVLAGATGSTELAELSYWQLHKGGVTFEALRRSFDITLLDTGAGIQRSVVSMLTHADECLLVVTPDPSSVQDAYVTLRVLIERKPQARVGFIVNNPRDVHQANDVATKFQTFAQLHLDCQPRYLGYVPFDRVVPSATRSRTALLQVAPSSRAAKHIVEVAHKFAGIGRESVAKRLMSRFMS
jgi:flagellar biosynthesis protein FlhG